jgi:hypothetical protein
MTRGLAITATVSTGFNQTFYETVAGVIPVLFIAIAVEGRLIRGLSDASEWVVNLGGIIAKPLIAMALIWPVARESLAKTNQDTTPDGAQHEDGHLPAWSDRWIVAPLLLAMMLWYVLRPRRKRPQPREVSQSAQAVMQHGTRIGVKITRAASVIGFAITCVILALAASVAGVGIASEVLVILALYHEHAAHWTGTFVVSATISLVGAFAVGPAVGLINSAAAAARTMIDERRQDKAEVQDDQVTTPQPPSVPGAASLLTAS